MIKRFLMMGIVMLATATMVSGADDDKTKDADKGAKAVEKAPEQASVYVDAQGNKTLGVRVLYTESSALDRILQVGTVLLLAFGVIYLMMIRSDIERLLGKGGS